MKPPSRGPRDSCPRRRMIVRDDDADVAAHGRVTSIGRADTDARDDTELAAEGASPLFHTREPEVTIGHGLGDVEALAVVLDSRWIPATAVEMNRDVRSAPVAGWRSSRPRGRHGRALPGPLTTRARRGPGRALPLHPRAGRSRTPCRRGRRRAARRPAVSRRRSRRAPRRGPAPRRRRAARTAGSGVVRSRLRPYATTYASSWASPS